MAHAHGSASRARIGSVRSHPPCRVVVTAAVVALLAATLVIADVVHAAVFSWREGGTLYVANDPAAVPPGRSADRYVARSAATGAGNAPPRAERDEPAATPRRATPAVAVAAAPAPPPVAAAPIIIAPTIVVRQAAPSLTVVADTPWTSGWMFLPSGFIGHEHPQVPFLAGRRLVPHSHFFAHRRPGRFTPYGHFTTHGVLVDSVPSY